MELTDAGPVPRRAAVLLLLLPLVVAADGAPVEARATTVIHADGPSAVTLQLPKPARLGIYDIDVDLQDQPAAYVAFAPRRCLIQSEPEWRSWCPEPVLMHVADSPFGTQGYMTSNDPNLLAGLIDVYIVAHGPVTITAHFGHLQEGAVEVHTDRSANGWISEVPQRCLVETPDPCNMVGGGITGSVGDKGVATAVGWARNPDYEVGGETIPNVTQTKGVVVCLETEDHGQSVEPDDYRFGCPLTPDEDATSTWQQNQRNYLLNSGPLGFYGMSAMADRSSGRIYAGFTGHAASPQQLLGKPGHVGAWAGWIQADSP